MEYFQKTGCCLCLFSCKKYSNSLNVCCFVSQLTSEQRGSCGPLSNELGAGYSPSPPSLKITDGQISVSSGLSLSVPQPLSPAVDVSSVHRSPGTLREERQQPVCQYWRHPIMEKCVKNNIFILGSQDIRKSIFEIQVIYSFLHNIR